jgi:hypothetical protein
VGTALSSIAEVIVAKESRDAEHATTNMLMSMMQQQSQAAQAQQQQMQQQLTDFRECLQVVTICTPPTWCTVDTTKNTI